MDIKILGKIEKIEVIAKSKSIKKLSYLNKTYGSGRWRKLKGIAQVRFPSGEIELAEIHWFEAHGIGKKEMKIKKTL